MGLNLFSKILLKKRQDERVKDLCSGVKLLPSWLMGAQGTAKAGLWFWTGIACGLEDPVLAVTGCCKCRGCWPCVGLAIWELGVGFCSLSRCALAILVRPQGETGVEGGVNGLNPGVGFLSQALWVRCFNVRNNSGCFHTICLLEMR